MNDNGNDNGIITKIVTNTNKQTTIKQFAKAAGVSTQTVSRVINNRPDVGPVTRERIQQVIEEFDYRWVE